MIVTLDFETTYDKAYSLTKMTTATKPSCCRC
jgi:hypothetical protein